MGLHGQRGACLPCPSPSAPPPAHPHMERGREREAETKEGGQRREPENVHCGLIYKGKEEKRKKRKKEKKKKFSTTPAPEEWIGFWTIC
ncbi:unnamed protein product [Nyctereutes procyonoides]|uniref:(raccoon dog) hypothetical protein n=1 Tax=Nyctereutes procyonoides TaxID=34880 RepID=A0A811Y1B5_NYCPR|nr:unnamed protein product [Nyctereutes procyonoides]